MWSSNKQYKCSDKDFSGNWNFRVQNRDSRFWPQMLLFEIEIFRTKIGTPDLGPKCSNFKYEFFGPKSRVSVLPSNVPISNENFWDQYRDRCFWLFMFLFQNRILRPNIINVVMIEMPPKEIKSFEYKSKHYDPIKCLRLIRILNCILHNFPRIDGLFHSWRAHSW